MLVIPHYVDLYKPPDLLSDDRRLGSHFRRSQVVIGGVSFASLSRKNFFHSNNIMTTGERPQLQWQLWV